MQVILGSSGVIGRGLARILPAHTGRLRLVSRNPSRFNPSDETFAADLVNADQAFRAVEGAEIAYLTVGLAYNTRVWQMQWPVLMKSVIEACKKQNVKLVFFDNVYMYGRVHGPMTEETPVHPVSRKGEVRAAIADMLMNEVRLGNLHALIARSADFYGPGALGFVQAMVFDNLMKGRKAQWLVNDGVKHSLTYTPDAAKATAKLGNSAQAFDQVWHLPTDGNAPTGKEFIAMAASASGASSAHMVLGPMMLRLAGLFNGIVRESIEMLYQYDSDYIFDSSKFDRTFPGMSTPYTTGVKETVASMAAQETH